MSIRDPNFEFGVEQTFFCQQRTSVFNRIPQNQTRVKTILGKAFLPRLVAPEGEAMEVGYSFMGWTPDSKIAPVDEPFEMKGNKPRGDKV